MNCCNDYGNCDQGRDCPVRKQRMEATNQAYIERNRVADTDPYTDTQCRDCPVRKKRAQETYKEFYEMNLKVPDPYVETIGSVKELFFVIFVTAALTLLAFILWGM